MKTLIGKYPQLSIDREPLLISAGNEVDYDKKGVEDPFSVHCQWTPHEEKFPLNQPFPNKFHLHILSIKKGLRMHEFLTEVKAKDSLFLVGIQGIICLGIQYPSMFPSSGYSPAYYYEEAQILSGEADEAQIPYFFVGNKEYRQGKKCIGYSRFAASRSANLETLLLGEYV